MKDRVKAVRKGVKLTQEEFGKHIGLTRRGYQSIENGDSNITEGTLRLICSEFHINRHWLETGEGDMKDNAADDLLEMLLHDESESVREKFRDFFAAWDKLPSQQMKDAVMDGFVAMLNALKKEDE